MLKFITKTLVIILIAGIVTILGVFVFIVYSGEKEVIELTNDFNGEKNFRY